MAEKTREVAIINPTVSAHREKTPSHEKLDVVETGPTSNGTVTGEEAPSPGEKVAAETEQIQPEMDRISDLPQPVVEIPQETLDPAEVESAPEQAFSTRSKKPHRQWTGFLICHSLGLKPLKKS